MKPIEGYNKLRGGYYTPDKISEFIAEWAIRKTSDFALSETLGRSYGGGVLTFEPGEMRKIRIPMKMSEHLDLQKIDQLQRDGKIEEILQYTDKILLHDGLGLSEYEIVLLRSIWNKLRDRRMTRKNRKIRH